MTRKKRSETPENQWEQALLDAYGDYRWRETLEPLYQKFQQWRAGEMDHLDMDEAIHQTHKNLSEKYLKVETRHDKNGILYNPFHLSASPCQRIPQNPKISIVCQASYGSF